MKITKAAKTTAPISIAFLCCAVTSRILRANPGLAGSSEEGSCDGVSLPAGSPDPGRGDAGCTTSSGAASWKSDVTGCAAFSSMASPEFAIPRSDGDASMFSRSECAMCAASAKLLPHPTQKRFRAALSAPQTGQRRCSLPPSRWLSPIYPPSIVLDCIARVQGDSTNR